MNEDWQSFLAPYEQAVEELKVKLKGIRTEYERQQIHSPIEFVSGRVKTKDSISEKAEVRHISFERIAMDMQDVGGVRIMCQFVEDIYEVVALLRKREDFKILVERDYIQNKKISGYRSFHVVIEYPVERIDGRQLLIMEIQIRTLAMNFWATIEHSLNYKYKGDYPKTLHRRLENAAEAAFRLDEEMSKIREEIYEAEHDFNRAKGHK